MPKEVKVDIIKKIKEPKGELADWVNLIIGNEGGIEMASKRNKVIAKVNEENKKLSTNKAWQDWYELKWRIDENTRNSVAEERTKREIAKKMKDRGMNIKDIIEITGLSMREIEEV